LATNDIYTVSLLHFDGLDASTSLIDETGKTWTTSGNIQLDTAQSKFGMSSVLFDGVDDYFYGNGSPDFAFGTEDFTIDFWFRINSTTSPAANNCLFDFRPWEANGYPVIYFDTNNNLRFYISGSIRIFGTTAITEDAWHHFALARASGNTKMFLDGIQEGDTYADSNDYLIYETRPLFGVDFTASSDFGGWIDELRFSKGIARWTSNFTPPTKSYRPPSETWLPYLNPLTSGSGPIISASQYKFGTASGYFSGSGTGIAGYLTSETDFNFGSQDLTIDFWIRPDLSRITSDPNRGLFGYVYDTNNYWGIFIAGSALNNQQFAYNERVSGSWTYASSGSYMPLQENIQQHVAIVKQGTSLKGYLDGINYFTTNTGSSVPMFSGQMFRIGQIGLSGWYRGYIDEFRISVGIARWTSNFTPPTAPYAPIPPFTTAFARQPVMYSSYGWI
jgi:hypothetical protein